MPEPQPPWTCAARGLLDALSAGRTASCVWRYARAAGRAGCQTTGAPDSCHWRIILRGPCDEPQVNLPQYEIAAEACMSRLPSRSRLRRSPVVWSRTKSCIGLNGLILLVCEAVATCVAAWRAGQRGAVPVCTAAAGGVGNAARLRAVCVGCGGRRAGHCRASVREWQACFHPMPRRWIDAAMTGVFYVCWVLPVWALALVINSLWYQARCMHRTAAVTRAGHCRRRLPPSARQASACDAAVGHVGCVGAGSGLMRAGACCST